MVDLRHLGCGIDGEDTVCGGWYCHIFEFGKEGEDVAYLRGISMGVKSANVSIFQA